VGEGKFLEVVSAVCNRPTIYTPSGSFTEVSIFLEGFALGANVGGLKHQDAHSKFTPFFQWRAAGLGQQYLGDGWKDFRAAYSDDEAALNGLTQSYWEYAESVDASNVRADD
jgi:hypothetical protein